MGDAFDEALRLLAEYKRQRWKLTPQRELEQEILREEQRRAAWMDVPEWRTFWDEASKDFKVPEGWPAGSERQEKEKPEPDVEEDTLMHRMLKDRKGFAV
ncbi:hypothetical protein [Reyranella sp.]|uniref:hypothetical protein n=1 Tax=Reyranella sp. TaxID=1929291 RepID=UPI0027313E23|nr:hypothetical protein [Reyranella sp.]MDP2374271.1 hypothetical protein [Reyranella sp.]